MIWALIALMTGVAVLAVLWPLSRRGRDLRQASDVAVYKDQLEEIERDQSFGLIAPAEADAARVEVSRRLLAADSAVRGRKAAATSPPARRRAVAAGALVVVPAGAIAVYLALGSPDLPGAPLSSRVTQAHGGDQSIEAMFARVEQHLAEHPEDGRGWEVVAPIYMRLGRYDDAVKARRNAARLLGATAERWSYLGEALVAQENGVVTGAAKEAFDNALKLDPQDIAARFYGGLAAEQDGRKDDATRIWKALAADAPPGAEWLPAVQRAIARTESAAPGASAAAPGSDAARGMVERLAARLQQDGSDVDGWLQLVRSYKVLKDPAKASAAEADARRALAGDGEKLARLETGLKELAGVSEAAALPPPQEMGIDQMVARLAARLQRDGSNVEGWIQLVRSYRVLEQPDKASAAEADARRALAQDPNKLAMFEAGIKQAAAAPPRAGDQGGADQRATGPTAPGAGSATAPAMSNAAPAAPGAPAQPQDQMIRGMVDRLAARLHEDGSDVDGWLRLLRSYMVLGEADKARAAAAEARNALKGDADKLRRLDEGAKSLGVGG